MLNSDYRRIPVIDENGKVVHVITFSQVVSLLFKGLNVLSVPWLNRTVSSMAHIKQLMEKMDKFDSKLDLYDLTGVIQCNKIAKVIEAFRLIIGTHVSAVPVVDSNNKIMGCVSIRDIRAISNNASDLKVLYDEDCGTFLKRSGLKLNDIVVKTEDTFENVIRKFYQTKIHRLWLVDEENVILGAVTLKNLLNEIVHA